MQEVKLLCDIQEILKGMIEDKTGLRSRATDNITNRFFEEMKELEEKKSEEALLLVQKKSTLCGKHQNERDVARRLQRFGSSRRMKTKAGSQDLLL